MPLSQYITTRYNKIIIGSAAGVGLIISAIAGISLLTPAYVVQNPSGQDVWKVDISGRQSGSGDVVFGSGSQKTFIYNNGVTFAQRTLSGGDLLFRQGTGSKLAVTGILSCNTVDTDSRGNLVCGSDDTGSSTFGTGNVLTIADARYVNQSGDTMTGALKIRANLSGSTLNVDNLNSCDTIDTNAAGRLACGTDNTGTDSADDLSDNTTSDLAEGTNLYYVQSRTDARYVNTAGDTMTGTLILQPSSGLALNARGTISGSLITQNGAGSNYFLGNVGIGTVTPSARLSVAGTMSGRQLYISGTGSTPVIYTNGGKVGIGTTGPNTLLTIAHSAYNEGKPEFSIYDGYYRYNIGYDARAISGTDGYYNSVYFSSAQLHNNLGSVNSGFYFDIAGATKMTIATSGNVGIGTATPSTKLSVAGTMSGKQLYVSGTGATAVMYTNGGNTIFNAGNVGIGTTRPGAVLDIYRSGNAQINLQSTNAAFITLVGAGSPTTATISKYSDGTFRIGNELNSGTNHLVIGTTGNVGIGTSTPTAKLSVAGTMSGKQLYVSGTGASPVLFTNGGQLGIGTSAISQALHVVGGGYFSGNVGIGTTSPKTKLEIVGTISGSALVVSGLNAANCDLKAANGVVSCGTDADTNSGAWSGTGALQTAFDTRYVNTAGDTMTGSLVVTGTLNATQTLSSSGTLVWEGSASGASLWLSKFEGAGLTDCDTAGTSKLLWDATAKRFSCGTDTDTNTTYTAAQGLSLNGTAFSLNATHSGSIINAVNTLSSSGTLVWEGAGSGSSLWLSKLAGAGLVDCDTALTSKLLWDTTNQRFSCGTDTDTDTNTTYTVGQGLTLAGTVISLTASHSGSTIRAVNTLASSGSVVWEGSASGASLWVSAFEGAGLVDCDTAGTSKLLWDATNKKFSCGADTDTNTTYTAGQGLTLAGTSFSLTASHSGSTIHAVNTLSSSGTLVWEGSASGSSLWVSTLSGIGLVDCDTATTSKLLWDSTTSKFSCGTDNSGQSQATTDARYVNTAGDTMTGALTVKATISGSLLKVNGEPVIAKGTYKKQMAFVLAGSGTTVTVGTDQIPMIATFSGTLVAVRAEANTAGNGLLTTDVFLHGADALSTNLTVDASEVTSSTAAAPAAISAANRYVSIGDRIRVDVISDAGATKFKGLTIILFFNVDDTGGYDSY